MLYRTYRNITAVRTVDRTGFDMVIELYQPATPGKGQSAPRSFGRAYTKPVNRLLDS